MKLRPVLIFLNLSLFLAIFLASGNRLKAAAQLIPPPESQSVAGAAESAEKSEAASALLFPISVAAAPNTVPGETPESTPEPVVHSLQTQPQEHAPPAGSPPPSPVPPFENPGEPPVELVYLGEGINPLTGLPVSDPALLERRPMGIKVTNFPREVRPYQFGLNLADLVYEYYLEFGMTRFFAIFYGQDAEKVGPVRSARFFDEHLVRMYKSVFVFANADRRVLDHLLETDLVNLFVVERPENCPPMCRERYRPGYNTLYTSTRDLGTYIVEERGMTDERQDLAGMAFSDQPPPGGILGESLATIYSNYSYNLWEYDPGTGRYLRFEDTRDIRWDTEEDYATQIDQLTRTQVAADNVVVLLMPHYLYSEKPEILTMQLWGYGTAYAFRDGKVYKVYWGRPAEDSVLILTNPDGSPYPLKPGNTFFQVIGQTSDVWQFGPDWRFEFQIP